MSVRAARAAASCLLSAWLAAGASAAFAAQELPESNLSLLDRTISAAARRVVNAAPLAPGSRVALKRRAETPLDLEAQQALLRALTARQIEVWIVSESAPESTANPQEPIRADTSGTNESDVMKRIQAERAARLHASEVFDPGSGSAPPSAPEAIELPLLTYQVEEARVDYPRLFRTGLFGGLHVERRALSRLSAQLLRPHSRAVYWVGAADTSVADHVARSEITLLEDASRPETRGTVPQQSWQKVIEPVLVVALVAGLVSLFYTNRP